MAEAARVEVKPFTRREWALTYAYIAVMAAVFAILTLFIPQPWASGFNPGPSGGNLCAVPFPWLVATIMLFLISRNVVKIDKSRVALLYIASMIAVMYTMHKGYFTIFPSAFFNIRVATAQVHGYALPMFWMPSESAVRGMFYSGSLNNLFVVYAQEWAPVIATHIFYYTTVIAFLMGWAGILRRLWVEIEVLPFPHAQGWLIAEAAYQPGPSRFRRWLLIAFFIGLLVYVPYWFFYAYPGFPDLYGWQTAPGFGGSNPGTWSASDVHSTIRSMIAGPVTIAFDPLRYAFCFLAPLDTLFSWGFGHVLFFIVLPQILTYFGYYTGIYNTGVGGKLTMIARQPPLYGEAVYAGMGLGVLVFMVLVNWRYFWGTVKSAVSGGSAGVAPGEVSFRFAWLLTLLGAVGWIALMVVSNVPPPLAVLGLAIVWMQTIVGIRCRAYTGVNFRLRGVYYWKPFLGDTVPPAPNVPPGQLFIVSHTCRWGTGTDTWGPYYVTLGVAMDSFKVGQVAGLRADTVYKLLITGAILAAIVTIPTIWIGIHAFGFMQIPAPKEWDFMWDGDAGFYNPRPSIASIPSLVGFLAIGAITYLRIKFPWWPLEPLGFALAFAPETVAFIGYTGTFTPLIVWAVKYLVLKIGGRKFYEEVALPFAIGIIAGEVAGIIGVNLILVARYAVFGAR